ncbi:hypothetical protein ScPMuIL_009932 [Solemya velum]
MENTLQEIEDGTVHQSIRRLSGKHSRSQVTNRSSDHQQQRMNNRQMLVICVALYSLAASLSVFCAPTKAKNSEIGFIVGGQDADPSTWPWQAKLTDNGQFFCGGTLLDSDVVITAGHCISNRDLSGIGVAVGNRERFVQQYNVSNVIMHPEYKDYMQGSDIAIVCLGQNVSISPEVSPVPEVASLSDNFESDSYCCFITGWGLLSSGSTRKTASTLQQAEINIITNARCNSKRFWDGRIKSSNICAFKKKTSACEGDSGGPLVCQTDNRHILVGVTSWGSTSCKNYPSVFTRLSVYATWIESAKRKCRVGEEKDGTDFSKL